MQTARSHRGLAEVTLDALAADLTVPHARPLVDLERDDYADVEIGEPATVPFLRERMETEPIARKPRGYWSPPRIAAAVWSTALGFGLGAGITWFLI